MNSKDEARAKRIRRIAMFAGIALALICKSLPPDYREVCEALSQLCTGGF